MLDLLCGLSPDETAVEWRDRHDTFQAETETRRDRDHVSGRIETTAWLVASIIVVTQSNISLRMLGAVYKLYNAKKCHFMTTPTPELYNTNYIHSLNPSPIQSPI